MTHASSERIFDCSRALVALQADGPGPKWTVHCPTHEDNKASLSIHQKPDGTLLVKCQAGCRTEEVLQRLGLSMSDLYPRTQSPSTPRHRREVAVYQYHDEAGKLLHEVVRYEPKEFRHRRPDGEGGWIWDMNGVKRVPYRLPEIIEAIAHGRRIWIVEGERDADNLWSIGLPATTNSAGAGKGYAEFVDALQGAAVTVLPDNDEPGMKHAERIAEALHGKAADIRVVALPGLAPKEDVSDWLSRGGTANELERLNELAATWFPASAPTSSLRVLSLRELVELPPPEFLVADFLPAEAFAIIFAPPGSGKSFVVLDLILSIAAGRNWHGRETASGPVVYVAAEGNAGQIGKRVSAWCSYHDVSTTIPMITVDGYVDLGSEAAVDELASIVPPGTRAIIIDTLSRCMPGADENRTSDVSRIIRAADRLRSISKATVVFVHHARKHDNTLRGSSALEGAADTVISLRKQGPAVRINCEKQKDAAEFSEFWLRLEPCFDSAVMVDMAGSSPSKSKRLTVNDRLLLGCLPNDGTTSAQWLQLFNKAPSSFHKSRNRLIEQGLVEEDANGVYRHCKPAAGLKGESDDQAA